MEIDMLANSIEDIKTATLEPLSNKESEPKRRMPHKYEIKLINRFNKMLYRNYTSFYLNVHNLHRQVLNGVVLISFPPQRLT